jgi:predicted nucleic acid-binding protein
MIVFSDTYPICCLILIDQVNILQELHELVIIPQAQNPHLSFGNGLLTPLIVSRLELLASPQGRE